MRLKARSRYLFASTLALALIAGTRSLSTQSATVNGTLRLQVDAPVAGAAVLPPFGVGGWAIDQASAGGTGIDAVQAYMIPASGAPILAGAATLGAPRPDVAAMFGAQFAAAGFNLVVSTPLPPGSYT